MGRCLSVPTTQSAHMCVRIRQPDERSVSRRALIKGSHARVSRAGGRLTAAAQLAGLVSAGVRVWTYKTAVANQDTAGRDMRGAEPNSTRLELSCLHLSTRHCFGKKHSKKGEAIHSTPDHHMLKNHHRPSTSLPLPQPPSRTSRHPHRIPTTRPTPPSIPLRPCRTSPPSPRPPGSQRQHVRRPSRIKVLTTPRGAAPPLDQPRTPDSPDHLTPSARMQGLDKIRSGSTLTKSPPRREKVVVVLDTLRPPPPPPLLGGR